MTSIDARLPPELEGIRMTEDDRKDPPWARPLDPLWDPKEVAFGRRPRAPGKPPLRPVYPGSDLLYGTSPRQILSRLIDGDPLGMLARCQSHLAAHGYLLSVERLWLRTLARVAHAAVEYRGEMPLSMFLAHCLEQAVEDAQGEDREDERRQAPIDDVGQERYTFLAQHLGIDLRVARRTCVVINDLPDRPRKVFYALYVGGKTPDRLAAETGVTPAQVRAEAKRAILALSLMKDPGPQTDPAEEAGR